MCLEQSGEIRVPMCSMKQVLMHQVELKLINSDFYFVN